MAPTSGLAIRIHLHVWRLVGDRDGYTFGLDFIEGSAFEVGAKNDTAITAVTTASEALSKGRRPNGHPNGILTRVAVNFSSPFLIAAFLRRFFIVRPAWAHSCGWKSRHELVTASEVKRNCVRATERGEEAWSVNRAQMNKNRI